MALNPTGSLLVVTIYKMVDVYSTANGHLVANDARSENNVLQDEVFVTAGFLDESVNSIITVTSPEAYQGETLAVDKYKCALMISNRTITLFNVDQCKPSNSYP